MSRRLYRQFRPAPPRVGIITDGTDPDELARAVEAFGGGWREGFRAWLALRDTTIEMIARQAPVSFAEWLRDRRNSRQIPHRLEDAGYVAVRNDGQKDGRWKVDGRNQVIYAKRSLSVREQIAAARELVGW